MGMLRQKRLRSILIVFSQEFMMMIQQGASPITTNTLRMCGGTIERKFSGTLVLRSFQLRRGHPKQVGASWCKSIFFSLCVWLHFSFLGSNRVRNLGTFFLLFIQLLEGMMEFYCLLSWRRPLILSLCERKKTR